MIKELLLEKYIKKAIRKSLREAEEQAKQAEKAMYLIYRFPGLKKLMEDLMSPAYGRFISNINLVAPKPTTFVVKLINGEDFNISYIGKDNFIVKISGKRYDPINIGDLERASRSISDLLELNYAPAIGAEKEQEQQNSDIAADLSAASNTPEISGETPPNNTPNIDLSPGEETLPKDNETPEEEIPKI
jgi:hypothetical protein